VVAVVVGVVQQLVEQVEVVDHRLLEQLQEP
jgi:hypothetical protein